ncbi:MAG: PqqD family protein [Pirellulales bacterium]
MMYADTRRFPHDTVDGETVIIDSTVGRLYLLTGLGSWIWQRMVLGHTTDGIVGDVAARYGAEAGREAGRFLAALLDNEMLTREPGDLQTTGFDLPMPEVFVAPGLETYDDIADIIAMDPIHEVDPTRGWPHR